MKISIVNIHSFIDVITNSSTELFVSNNNNDVEMVKTILEEILEHWNKLNDSSYTMSIFGLIEKFDYSEYIKCLDTCKSIYVNELFHTINQWFPDTNDYYIESERKEHIRYKLYDNDYDNHLFYKYKSAIEKKYGDVPSIYTMDRDRTILNHIYSQVLNGEIPKPNWWDNPWILRYGENPVMIKDLDQKIIIIGSYDDSIPYDMWDIINKKLNAENFHLG